jgi:hypothetical protein
MSPNMLRLSLAVGLGLFLNSVTQVNQSDARLLCDRMDRDWRWRLIGNFPSPVYQCAFKVCHHMIRLPGRGPDSPAVLMGKCYRI